MTSMVLTVTKYFLCVYMTKCVLNIIGFILNSALLILNVTACFLHMIKYDDEESDYDGFDDEDDLSNGWPYASFMYSIGKYVPTLL